MKTLTLPVTYNMEDHQRMVVEVDAHQAAQLMSMANDEALSVAIGALRHIAGLSGLNSDFDRAEAAKHRALRALERIGAMPCSSR